MSPIVVKKPIKVEPMPVDGDGYNERYYAYLDRTFKFLRTLLETLHTPQKGTEKSWHTCFRAQSISDAVAISTLATPDGLIQIFHAIEKLATDLLKRGYFIFIRGGLVKGKFYQDEKMVFGEALVDAYRVETQLARYPRVIVMSDIVRDIEGYCEQASNWKGALGSTQVIAPKPMPAQLSAVVEAARSVSRDLGWKGKQ
jgi:hypothetical protein